MYATPPPTYPVCVTTTWGARHAHKPKTRPGATCRVLGTNGPAPGSTGYVGTIITQFNADWFPASWPTIGYVVNSSGDVVALLVRRPR